MNVNNNIHKMKSNRISAAGSFNKTNHVKFKQDLYENILKEAEHQCNYIVNKSSN